MIIHFSIPKQEVEHIKYRVRKKINEGMPLKESISYGVKQFSKLVDKKLPKHRRKLLNVATALLVKAFKEDQEHLKDQMQILNEQAYENQNLHHTETPRPNSRPNREALLSERISN